MLRPMLVCLACAALVRASGQSFPGESPQPLAFTSTFSVAQSGLQLFDNAMEAWAWTFGKEPGGKLTRSDRESGVLEGVARVNFRSQLLTMRDETMGVVNYRVQIAVRAGECRLSVTELTHTGNRGAPRGGLSAGLLMRPQQRPKALPGMSGASTKKLLDELEAASGARISAVLHAFEARVRAHAEP
jgi:hypothetical protein